MALREPKERPIIFSTPMVQAVLEDRKTQTRRIVKPQPGDDAWWCAPPYLSTLDLRDPQDRAGAVAVCPYGRKGGRLYVREAWRAHERPEDLVDGILFRADDAFVPIENTREAAEAWGAVYRRTPCGRKPAWRPSIHMPKWATRLWLELTEVRIERLSEMRADDIVAEGVDVPDVDYSVADDPRALEWERDCHARGLFQQLWDGLNAKRGYAWATNPWVWVLTFRRIER